MGSFQWYFPCRRFKIRVTVSFVCCQTAAVRKAAAVQCTHTVRSHTTTSSLPSNSEVKQVLNYEVWVLTTIKTPMLFLVVTSCKLVSRYRRFGRNIHSPFHFWRWRQYMCPKRRCLLRSLRDVTTQKDNIFRFPNSCCKEELNCVPCKAAVRLMLILNSCHVTRTWKRNVRLELKVSITGFQKYSRSVANKHQRSRKT